MRETRRSPEEFREAVSSLGSPQEVTDWVAEQLLGPSAMEPSLRHAVWQAVARYARFFDRFLLERLYSEPGALAEAARDNSHLHGSEEARTLLLEICAERLEAWNHGKVDLEPALLAIRWVAYHAAVPSTGPLGERFWKVALSLREKGIPAETLLEALAESPDLSADRLLELMAGEQGKVLRLCIWHPNADARVWKAALGESPWQRGVLEELAQVEGARRVPEVRRALRAFGALAAPIILKSLAEDRLPGEFAGLFQEALERDLDLASALLAESSPTQRAELEREALAPLLASSSPEHRLRAIAALGPPQQRKGSVVACSSDLFSSPLSRTAR